MILKNAKFFCVGALALYFQLFLGDYLSVSGSLANFLLPFALLCYLIWGMSKKSIWLLFFLGIGCDVVNANLFGFTPFVLLSALWLASKLFLVFNDRSIFSCLLVLLLLTIFYQAVFYAANILLISQSSVGTFWQTMSYFAGSLFSNAAIFIFLSLLFHLKLKFHE